MVSHNTVDNENIITTQGGGNCAFLFLPLNIQ